MVASLICNIEVFQARRYGTIGGKTAATFGFFFLKSCDQTIEETV